MGGRAAAGETPGAPAAPESTPPPRERSRGRLRVPLRSHRPTVAAAIRARSTPRPGPAGCGPTVRSGPVEARFQSGCRCDGVHRCSPLQYRRDMTPPRSLAGQRVLITGAARGIGAALAEKLSSRGVRLALVGLESDKLAEVAARCGEDTFFGECDVSSFQQVTQAIDAAADAMGGLDVVVANAGIATGGPLRSQDLRSWERVIEINLLGVMYTDRAALPHLERSRGYLLNIASSAAAC